jgi:hypothetical protein
MINTFLEGDLWLAKKVDCGLESDCRLQERQLAVSTRARAGTVGRADVCGGWMEGKAKKSNAIALNRI